MMKSSEISNENVSCGHTQDGQHGYACQHRAAAVREIWGKLDLVFTFSGMQVTTIGITFCPFLQLSRPDQEFWAQLIKTYHQTDESNPILLTS